MPAPVAMAVVARTLATGYAIEVGAGDVALWVGVIVGAVTVGSALLAAVTKLARGADRAQDAYEYVRKQMEENGRSKAAGTTGQTQRDVLDDQTIALTQLAEDLRLLRADVCTLHAGQERVEVNQREQGQKIAAAVRQLDDHLIEANESQRMLETHLAEHEEAEQEP